MKHPEIIKQYSVEYIDRNGAELTTLFQTDQGFRIRIRNHMFYGHHPSDWQPEDKGGAESAGKYTFDKDGYLTDFCLNVSAPITVVTEEGNEAAATVHVFCLNYPDRETWERFSSERYEKEVCLEFRDKRIKLGRSLEYGLDRNYTRIPGVAYAKTCINCVYGDYSHAGNEDNWDMLCFRNCKSEFLDYMQRFDYKKAQWKLFSDESIEVLRTEETSFCQDFELKKSIGRQAAD